MIQGGPQIDLSADPDRAAGVPDTVGTPAQDVRITAQNGPLADPDRAAGVPDPVGTPAQDVRITAQDHHYQNPTTILVIQTVILSTLVLIPETVVADAIAINCITLVVSCTIRSVCGFVPFLRCFTFMKQ